MKAVFITLGWVVFAVFVLVGFMYFNQRNMMYFPSSTKPDIKQTGIIGLEEITVKTDDGLALYGWYLKPASVGKPTLVWFHGNGSHVGWAAYNMAPFLKEGYGILLAEYRGFASNPGKPTEEGLYKDARAFLNWLKATGTDEHSIILYGESIGSGPAVQMATEYKIHTLVLQTPFTSMVDSAGSHYPFLPVNILVKDRYDNLSKISKIQCPLIIVHGTADSIIPYKQGEALFKAAPDPKSMITIEGGEHNNLHEFNAIEKVANLLAE